MKKKKSKEKKSVLVLFDHDGTFCQTNHNAYDSIKYAANKAFSLVDMEAPLPEINWDVIFHETKGTTEAYLARVLAFRYLSKIHLFEAFANYFYQARANWYHEQKQMGEFVDDSYYPDIEELLTWLSKNYDCHLGLVTGNPRSVLAERLKISYQKIFRNHSKELMGAFGNEAESRADLLLLALERFQKYDGFKPQKDSNGYLQNVFYIADSENDFFSGLDAKMQMVWIPDRALSAIHDIKAKKHIQFIGSHAEFAQFVIVNNAMSSELLSYFQHKLKA
ncbi:MAG TPA: HAD hydrolase-like protein [Candidatus Woesebacteria bacterium]|nr:HAD hydrolase-like protein [Candidatus Woesebacteria bacterium]